MCPALKQPTHGLLPLAALMHVAQRDVACRSCMTWTALQQSLLVMMTKVNEPHVAVKLTPACQDARRTSACKGCDAADKQYSTAVRYSNCVDSVSFTPGGTIRDNQVPMKNS